jgi:hypothetical protein
MLVVLGNATNDAKAEGPYQPTWESLATYPIPDWFQDGKFGIYTHWGVYSVPAHITDIKYYSSDYLIDQLIDIVSKNGVMLLNVGPKPDGTIPEKARQILLGMRQWLAVNGESIYLQGNRSDIDYRNIVIRPVVK